MVPPNRSHRLLAFALPEASPEEEGVQYCWARWRRGGVVISSHYHWLAPWRDVSLPEPGLQWEVSRGAQQQHAVTVSAERYAWLVTLAPADRLEVEDNYLDLLPGESRTIRVQGPPEALDNLTVSASNHLLGG